MFTLRRFLPRAWLLPLLLLAGCESVLNIQPQENRGGFVVLVDVPGQPASPRVVADIGAFAQRRGFVRQTTGATPGRYLLGKITLDVAFQPANSRVTAYLHSFSGQLNRKFGDTFYRDFSQQYAGPYGGEGNIVQTDFAYESGGPPKGNGGSGGHRGGGGSGGGGGGSGGGSL